MARCRFIALFVLLSAALGAGRAAAQKLQLDTQTGGGALASNGGFKLSGAMLSYGQPDASHGTSSVGAYVMRSNFYPALSFVLVLHTAADPLWLRMTAHGTGAPANLRAVGYGGRGEAAARMLALEPDTLRTL